jgi:hypothetical protein
MVKASLGPTTKREAREPTGDRQVIRVKGNKTLKTGLGKPAETAGGQAPGSRAGFRGALGGMSPRR